MSGRVPSLKVIERAYVTDRVRHTKLTAPEAREEFRAGIASIERAAATRALEGAAEDVEGIKNAARDGMNKSGPYPWHATEGVADWLRARAAAYRQERKER